MLQWVVVQVLGQLAALFLLDREQPSAEDMLLLLPAALFGDVGEHDLHQAPVPVDVEGVRGGDEQPLGAVGGAQRQGWRLRAVHFRHRDR